MLFQRGSGASEILRRKMRIVLPGDLDPVSEPSRNLIHANAGLCHPGGARSAQVVNGAMIDPGLCSRGCESLFHGFDRLPSPGDHMIALPVEVRLSERQGERRIHRDRSAPLVRGSAFRRDECSIEVDSIPCEREHRSSA